MNEVSSAGFHGTITNTSLPDVIQLLCIGRVTCQMSVRSGGKRGFINFREGEIVHAEAQDLKGEEAFYNILSWDLGFFECRDLPDNVETIQESWDFLLMESMRRAGSFTASF
jgi:hypothetical protein